MNSLHSFNLFSSVIANICFATLLQYFFPTQSYCQKLDLSNYALIQYDVTSNIYESNNISLAWTKKFTSNYILFKIHETNGLI